MIKYLERHTEENPCSHNFYFSILLYNFISLLLAISYCAKFINQASSWDIPRKTHSIYRAQHYQLFLSIRSGSWNIPPDEGEITELCSNCTVCSSPIFYHLMVLYVILYHPMRVFFLNRSHTIYFSFTILAFTLNSYLTWVL